MSSLYVIGWLALLLISISAIFILVGIRSMVAFFPEGWRWWQLPSQLAALGFFATVVLFHPF